MAKNELECVLVIGITSFEIVQKFYKMQNL